MKEKVVLFIFACLMLGLMLTGCSDSKKMENTAGGTGTTDAAETETGTASEQTDEAAQEGDAAFTVAMMIPGSLGDKSFFDAAYNSIGLLETELGTKVDYVEAGTDSSKYYPAYVDLCEKGYDVILTISSNGDDALTQVAEEYPNQKFINLDGAMEEVPENVFVMAPKNNEMCYLAGAVAALKAKELGESTIGFVGGMDIPGINVFLVGYIEGAQQVDPDIKVASSYVGSFTDTAKGKENGLLLYNSGISVVFAAAGQSGLGVIDAAASKGKFAIGVDSDQAEALKDSQPQMADAIITSAIKNISKSAVFIVKEAITGNVEYGTTGLYGLQQGAVGIAENEYYEKMLSETDRKTVSDLASKVIDGEVVITDTSGMTTEQINAIRDQVRP